MQCIVRIDEILNMLKDSISLAVCVCVRALRYKLPYLNVRRQDVLRNLAVHIAGDDTHDIAVLGSDRIHILRALDHNVLSVAGEEGIYRPRLAQPIARRLVATS
jgi:hypothetical protein